MNLEKNYTRELKKERRIAKIIVPIAFILLAVGVVGYFLYSNNRQQESDEWQESNKEFVFDVIRTLDHVYQSRDSGKKVNDKEGIGLLESAYRRQEHILAAKNTMEYWVLDKDILRREITNKILNAIDDLLVAAETYINIEKNFLRKEDINLLKEDIALFNIKWEKGRENLLWATSAIVLGNDGKGINLSALQKKEIVNFVEMIFGKELEEYRASEDYENFRQPQEVWAAVIIRNGLSR